MNRQERMIIEMELVYLNTFERNSEGNLEISQLMISQQRNEWILTWSNSKDQMTQNLEQWYVGASYRTMVETYRERLIEKLTQGFILKMTEPMESNLPYKDSDKLQYYSEMNVNNDLLLQLKEWRKNKANQLHMSPFIVATNAMLQMVSTYYPTTTDDLAHIPGFSNQKINAYGEEIVTLVQRYSEKGAFPLDWVESLIDYQQFLSWKLLNQLKGHQKQRQQQQMKEQLIQFIDKHYSVEQMATQLHLKRSDIVKWLEDLAREGYDVSPTLQQELEKISDEEYHEAESAFREMGTQYLKPILEKIYDEEQISSAKSKLYDRLRIIRLGMKTYKGGKDKQNSA